MHLTVGDLNLMFLFTIHLFSRFYVYRHVIINDGDEMCDILIDERKIMEIRGDKSNNVAADARCM